MTEPRRRKAADYPPYRHTADRLADLEERAAHLLTWQAIGEQRDAALQNRIAALEIEVVHLKAANEQLTERLEALERQWQEDHRTLYILVNQRIDDLQVKLAQAEEQNAPDSL